MREIASKRIEVPASPVDTWRHGVANWHELPGMHVDVPGGGMDLGTQLSGRIEHTGLIIVGAGEIVEWDEGVVAGIRLVIDRRASRPPLIPELALITFKLSEDNKTQGHTSVEGRVEANCNRVVARACGLLVVSLLHSQLASMSERVESAGIASRVAA